LNIKPPEKEGGSHGVQGGGIGVIILRQWFFHWIGPAPGKFVGKDGLVPFSTWRDLLSGLSPRNIGEKFHGTIRTRRA